MLGTQAKSSYTRIMNKLDTKKRVQILQMLCEGSSMRSIARIMDVSFNTVVKLLIDAGNACSEYQDKVFRNLPCKRIQVDEIWSFCYCKDKNVPAAHEGEFGFGDVWTFTAICADSKLVPSWRVGNRNIEDAKPFIADLASRLSNRVQLTSDGHKMYLDAVEGAFGSEVDFAQLQKIYGVEREDTKYSPAKCLGASKVTIKGKPDMKQVSTSYVERQNLNMCMGMRRFTRLTNAFSKKIENHIHALSLYFMFYNFARIHKTLRVPPAMEAGIADHVWTIEEILNLV